MARTTDRRVALALVALLALGAWPWLTTIGLWPMAPDSGLWIARGAPFDPEWTRWVFGTRHFHVGYRPVTALSYTLNCALFGLQPLAFRATDLALHLAAAVGVWLVFQRLFRRASPWAALLAAGLFLAHPAIEEAVPFIARRSYALSTALALAGLAVWLGPRDRESRAGSLRCVISGALLALALLSNEVAVLPIAALPLIAWSRSGSAPNRFGRVAQCLLAPGVLLVMAVLLRLWVVGGIGGYEDAGEDASRFLPVFSAAWRAAAGLPTPLEPGLAALHWLLLGLALPYYALRCLSGSAEHRVLGLWILATTVLFALQDVWFPRQGYVFAAPVAMLVAALLFESLRGPRAAALRLLELAPQGLLLGTLLCGSAMLTGPDAQRTREWFRRDALIDDMLAEIGALEGPSDVHTVLPFKRGDEADAALKGNAASKLLPRGARQPVTWLKLLLREQDVRVQEFAYVLRQDLGDPGLPGLDTTSTPPVLVLPEHHEFLLRSGARWLPHDIDAERRVPFDPPRKEAGRAVFAYLAGVEGGELVPLGP